MLWRFFRPDEAARFEAIAARIWPGDAADPGAREAGAVVYLDRALADAYAHLQETYRRGLAAAERAAQERYGRGLAALGDGELDALLVAMEAGALTEFDTPGAAEFFGLCLTHTMEGVFSDPVHGGNRDFVGWRAIGYPGPHYTYSEADHGRSAPLERSVQSVSDLDPTRPDA
jgi:gluconate 2-dehydrogenase gamma chain